MGNSRLNCQAARRLSRIHAGSFLEELSASTAAALSSPAFVSTATCFSPQPTDPSICNSIRRFISTAYSIGSSFTSGSMKPLTIMVDASVSDRPRLIR